MIRIVGVIHEDFHGDVPCHDVDHSDVDYRESFVEGIRAAAK
jgi:hypothetical protein